MVEHPLWERAAVGSNPIVPICVLVMKRVPFIVKENFLNEDELSLVVKESTDLFQYLIDGKKTNPATLDGKILKQNMGIHYHDHYDNAHTSSDTVKIFNRKVFEDALYNEFEVEVLRDLCYNMDWNGMMLSYYKNGDH